MTDSYHKIKVLAIAPYSGLREILRQTGAGRHDIALTVLDGDNEEGLRVVQEEFKKSSYDLIISRGGTATLIRKNVSIPVLEVEITASDILHALRLADAYKGKSALVGFPATTKHASEMCMLLNNDIPIYTIQNASEADVILSRLRAEGYSLIIGDTVVSVKSVDAGLTPVLITSSQESIDKVFDQVSLLASLLSRFKQEKTILTGLLQHETSDLIAFDIHGTVLFSSKLNQDAALFLEELLSARIGEITASESCEFSRQYENAYLTASIASSEIAGVYFARIRHTALPSNTQKDFVQVFSGTADLTKNFFFQTKMAEIYFSQYPLEGVQPNSPKPVLLLGESGTFFDSIVSYLYEMAVDFHSSFTLIDLKHAKASNINWLLNNPYSPLFNTHSSIYFQNLEFMDADLGQELISFLDRSAIWKKNKLFFSLHTTSGASGSSGISNKASDLCRSLLGSVSAAAVHIQPLRNCADILSNIGIICISSLNMRYNKQIIGIEPEGLDQLKAYAWPDNFEQFYRVMKTLVQTSDAIMISDAEIRQTLRNEMSIYTPVVQPVSREIPFDLNRPLNEITLDIVRQVIANEQGNQKKAAETLGISRTTLWRMLKEAD